MRSHLVLVATASPSVTPTAQPTVTPSSIDRDVVYFARDRLTVEILLCRPKDGEISETVFSSVVVLPDPGP